MKSASMRVLILLIDEDGAPRAWATGDHTDFQTTSDRAYDKLAEYRKLHPEKENDCFTERAILVSPAEVRCER